VRQLFCSRASSRRGAGPGLVFASWQGFPGLGGWGWSCRGRGRAPRVGFSAAGAEREIRRAKEETKVSARRGRREAAVVSSARGRRSCPAKAISRRYPGDIPALRHRRASPPVLGELAIPEPGPQTVRKRSARANERGRADGEVHRPPASSAARARLVFWRREA